MGLSVVLNITIGPPFFNIHEPPPLSHHPQSHHPLSAALLIPVLCLASACFLVILSAVYCICRRRLRTTVPADDWAPPPMTETFVDEDHGPVVDHPIWYIRTAGLNPSVISAIAVCKYKAGDGLVEGTDCAVCLTEFEEGETLRLLPKCHHAFHISCIDTWLRSHTNCPLCRAGIVVDAAAPPLPSPASLLVPSSGRHGREPSVAVISEEVSEFRNGSDDDVDVESGLRSAPIRVENENLMEEGVCVDGRHREAAVDDIQALRRSVSLFSQSESIKNMSPATVVVSSSSSEDSSSRWAEDEKSNMELVVAKRRGVEQIQSLIEMTMNGSSRGKSLQPGPSSSVKRSLSCGAKLFMARYRRTS